MKKSLILFLILWLVGCTNTNQALFEEGRYCTNISNNKDIANWLVLEFEESKVTITNVLSSFIFNDSEYEISDNLLKITGKGLPSNENNQYVLVFEIKNDSITFLGQGSENFDAFNMKDGYVFTRNCE